VKLALKPDTKWDIEFSDLISTVGVSGFNGLGCPVAHAAPEIHMAYGSAGLACHELMALVIADNANRTVA
jgi:hypothetical protein